MEIEFEVDDGVALIGLAAPDRANALTSLMAEDLCRLIDTVDADGSIAALVIHGLGESFCGGADRALLQSAAQDPMKESNQRQLQSIYDCFVRLGTARVPVIAAVNGSAVGAGLNLVLAADLRIVAHDARLSSAFFGIGLHPGGGHMHLLARASDRQTVAAMAMFGIELDGDEAVRRGLAWEALNSSETLPRAVAIARKVARNPVLARSVVQSMRLEAAPDTSWDQSLAIDYGQQMKSFYNLAQNGKSRGA